MHPEHVGNGVDQGRVSQRQVDCNIHTHPTQRTRRMTASGKIRNNTLQFRLRRLADVFVPGTKGIPKEQVGML